MLITDQKRSIEDSGIQRLNMVGLFLAFKYKKCNKYK